MSENISDKLAGALALAIARNPRANLQQIAKKAGISKATLYRIAPTREEVIVLLLERATRHLEQALSSAELAKPPYPDALIRLTQNVIAGRDFYMFWNAAQWVRMVDDRKDAVDEAIPSFYGEALEEFFRRGQKEGVFRVDMPARWLTKAYDFMLYAAVDSALRGEIAPIDMAVLVNSMFLNGASSETEKG
ncbi:TetR/AcrR family transcriptional regulator [Pectobacterium peruviense]|uniref:Transcriptional regulator n=1 Tax=Pectobacterium peruviense TaxID=2066479 RepID=A0ABX4S511_9GAMM|nr:TetR/AcrR family transcriptional regulator [Pectobacterium peruviense]KML65730.1 transcriptional regulator [Pectobacterium peruviense]PKX82453.1 transcriptional regulator [Pectobacterium peruviense]PKX85136.1 transcriptional regulator [Pectobacterium peruviense]